MYSHDHSCSDTCVYTTVIMACENANKTWSNGCTSLKCVNTIKLALPIFTTKPINHTYLLGNKGEEYKLTV